MPRALKFQNGLSYEEIATVTDRSANAVGVMVHSALQALRREVRAHTDLIA
jgi:RNA polymerase sigma-70 factor (ECF subfamily)